MSLLYNVTHQLMEAPEYSADAEEMIDIIKTELDIDDSDIVRVSSKRFKLLVPSAERWDILDQLEKIDDFESDPNIKGSSMGGVKYKDAVVLIKPKEVQGRKSAGVDNEDVLENSINQYASKDSPIDVILDSHGREILVSDVVEAEGVGTHTSKYKKTDIILKRSSGKDYNISIKKDNAEMWESSDKRYKKVVQELIKDVKSGKHPEIYFEKHPNKNNIYTMYSSKTNKKISGLYKKIDDLKTVQDVVFGGDEVDAVVVRSFKKSDFSNDPESNELTVKVSYIIKKISDLKKYDAWPVLKIRHDVTRAKTMGLRPVIMTSKSIHTKKGTVKGTVKELE